MRIARIEASEPDAANKFRPEKLGNGQEKCIRLGPRFDLLASAQPVAVDWVAA